MEIENICRTCLSLNGPLLSIYDKNSIGNEGCVADMLSSFTKTKPKRADNMPEKVCLACISEINRCFSFKLKCENSNRTLRQLLPDVPPEETAEATSVPEKPVTSNRAVQTTPEIQSVKVMTKSVKMQTELCTFSTQHVQTETCMLNDVGTSPFAERDSQHNKCFKHNDVGSVSLSKDRNNEEDSFSIVRSSEAQRSSSGRKSMLVNRYHMGKVERNDGEIILELLDVMDDGADHVEKFNSSSKGTTENATYYEISPHNIVKDEDLPEGHEEFQEIVTRKRRARSPIPASDDQDSRDSNVNFTIFHKDGETQIVPNRPATRQALIAKQPARVELKCPECIMTFVSEKNLRRHMMKRHNWTEEALKTECFEVVSKEGLTSAQPIIDPAEELDLRSINAKRVNYDGEDDDDDDFSQNNNGNTKFFCPTCKATFAQRKSLTYHWKQNICKLKSFKCELCERVFISDDNLKKHMATHQHSNTCTQCFRVFENMDELSQHMVQEHNRNIRNQCNVCKKVFTMASALKDHLRTHSGEKPFQCPLCCKAFSQNANLKQHVMRHAKEKHFKCDDCSNSFVTKAELYSHKRMHTGDTPFSCEFCQMTFSTSSSLLKHRRKHTGERPYACDICPMRFAALNVLKNHRRTHTGEKPYKCEYCKKTFTQKGDCLNHQKIHTGQKTYTCLCGKVFKDVKEYRTHNNQYHSDKDAGRRTRSSGRTRQLNDDNISAETIDKERSMQFTVMDVGSDESNNEAQGTILTVATDDEMPIGSGDEDIIEMAIDLC